MDIRASPMSISAIITTVLPVASFIRAKTDEFSPRHRRRGWSPQCRQPRVAAVLGSRCPKLRRRTHRWRRDGVRTPRPGRNRDFRRSLVLPLVLPGDTSCEGLDGQQVPSSPGRWVSGYISSVGSGVPMRGSRRSNARSDGIKRETDPGSASTVRATRQRILKRITNDPSALPVDFGSKVA